MSKSVNLFWWYWLLAVTAGVAIFGLSMIFMPNLMYKLFDWMLFSADKSSASFSEAAISYAKFVYGVLGAVMVGWAVALFFNLLGPFRRGERTGWYAITWSIVIWFALDSSLSLRAGFVENALLNLGFLVLFMVPLAATYKYFHARF